MPTDPSKFADFDQKDVPLRTKAEGLEYELKPGMLTQARPARFATAAARYHFAGAKFSLYVIDATKAELAEDASGRTLQKFGDILDLDVTTAGDVILTRKAASGLEERFGFSLRGPDFALGTVKSLPALGVDPLQVSGLAELKRLGVTVEERGVRFAGFELQLAVEHLKTSPLTGPVVAELRRRGTKQGLKLVKDRAATGGSYDDTEGVVTITGFVRGTDEERRTVIRHELTHALFQASGATLPKGGAVTDPLIKADQERFALIAFNQTRDIGPISGDGGKVKPPTDRGELPAFKAAMARRLSTIHELNEAWIDLHTRFRIDDPEQTLDIRGLDVADESRYMTSKTGDLAGHGFDNVNEFVASFVVSIMQFQSGMIATVQRSLKCDNSPELAAIYAKVWDAVNAKISKLPGSNPFAALVASFKPCPANRVVPNPGSGCACV